MNNPNNAQIITHFIERIYEAVLTPNLIHEIVDDLRAHIDAPYGAFQIEDAFTHELGDSHLINYDDQALGQYADYFITKDPWTKVALEQNLLNKGFLAGSRVLTDRDYRNSEFYQDWGKQNSVRYAIGCSFTTTNNQLLKVCFQRHNDHSEFNEQIESFLNYLQPHLKRFVQLAPIFHEHKNNGHFHLLSQLDRPIWIVDQSLNIVFHNPMAAQWLSSGTILSAQNNQLVVKDHQGHKALSQQVRLTAQVAHNSELWNHAISSSAYDQVTLSHKGEIENLWLMPIQQKDHKRNNLIMITGRKPLPDTLVLQHIHGLSKRKAQICVLLMQGLAPQDIAEHLNISVNTYRNTLASCFRDLKVNNQSEMIQLLFASTSHCFIA